MLGSLLDLATASPWAYLALALIAALDVLVLLIPSESAAISAGVLAASGDLDLALVVGSVALGAFAGDSGAYALGRLAGRRLEPLLRRRRGLAERHAWAKRQLDVRGPLLLFVARFVPAGRTAATLAAGATRFRFRRFARFSALASTAWAAFVVSLGFAGGTTFADRPWLGLALGIGVPATLGRRREARASRGRRPHWRSHRCEHGRRRTRSRAMIDTRLTPLLEGLAARPAKAATPPAGTYLPIADHGVVGDLRTVALVGVDGTIDWYCPGRFDAPSVFAALLDAERGGHYRIAAVDECTTKQLYFPDTNVLMTRFLSPGGVGEVHDFMPVGGRQRLVRRVVCVRGEVRFRLECEPRFDYAREGHATQLTRRGAEFRAASLALTLTGPVPLERTARGVVAELVLRAGETATFALAQLGDTDPHLTEDAAGALFDETVAYWTRWIAQSTYSGRWREMVNRSALALKLLTYEPTGAIVAAPTTSLPEELGGGRNWDYRYTWLRDSAFTLYALLSLGFVEEARAFRSFLRTCLEATPPEADGPLQLMYGIDGRAELEESVLEHLAGYRGSAPVRIGNGAAGQLQLDVYGEVIDAAYVAETLGHGRLSYDAWRALSRIVDWLCENWNRPDEGIWETRGGRRHFTHSRLMSWVALDRAVRMARDRGFPADLVRWLAVRDEIFTTIMERHWNDERKAFVQHEGADVLDASVLLMPLVHFVAPDDPRWLSTLDAIGADLVSDSLVYRYDPAAAPDGLDGDEGTFSICSFWYVEALARAGRLEDARLAFEKMLTYANHLGLYSEEIGPSGELLGNFPQAFTHLALISAAVHLDRKLR